MNKNSIKFWNKSIEINDPQVVKDIINGQKNIFVRCLSNSSGCGMFSLRYIEPDYNVDDIISIGEPWAIANSAIIRKSYFDERFYSKIKWFNAYDMPKGFEDTLQIQIISVLLKRVQDIIDEEIMGINTIFRHMYISGSKSMLTYEFSKYWNDTHDEVDAYENNPWIWVYKFKCLGLNM